MGNRLKEVRKKSNLTLRELGSKVNMTSSRLSQYETSKREPNLETWQKLANFFNVSVAYLQGTSYDADDIFKILNDCFYKNTAFMSSIVTRYATCVSINPPDKLFNDNELKEYSPNVEKYWKNNFGFILENKNVSTLFNVEKDVPLMIPVEERIKSAIEFEVEKETRTPIYDSFFEIMDKDKNSFSNFYSDMENILKFNSKGEILKYINTSIKEFEEFKRKLRTLPDNKHY